jgi:hypothetical protein
MIILDQYTSVRDEELSLGVLVPGTDERYRSQNPQAHELGIREVVSERAGGWRNAIAYHEFSNVMGAEGVVGWIRGAAEER